MKKLLARHRILVILSILFVLGLVACGPAPETPAPPTAEPAQQPTATQPVPDAGPDAAAEEGYPPPTATTAVVEGSYPPPTQPVPTIDASYPDPEPENTPENGVPFAFERPVNAGDTVIRGVGPAGLEIRVVNVTFMGQEIATTTVGNDGRFEVEVPALESGVRIGLTADVEGTDLEQQVVPGEGAMGMPQVGYFFDTIVITDES